MSRDEFLAASVAAGMQMEQLLVRERVVKGRVGMAVQHIAIGLITKTITDEQRASFRERATLLEKAYRTYIETAESLFPEEPNAQPSRN